MMSLPDTKAPLVIRDMTKQLLYYPEILWGGTFLLSKKDGKQHIKLLKIIILRNEKCHKYQSVLIIE